MPIFQNSDRIQVRCNLLQMENSSNNFIWLTHLDDQKN
jgi:hypothetical protein